MSDKYSFIKPDQLTITLNIEPWSTIEFPQFRPDFRHVG